MFSLIDVILALVLFVAYHFGRKRGFAWQVAGIASLVCGHIAARRYAAPLHEALGAESPVTKVLAWVLIYVATAAAIYLTARQVRSTLKDNDLEELDSHLGGVLGSIKAALLLAIIALVVLTLSERSRGLLDTTLSGRALSRLVPLVKDYLPRETWNALGPRIDGQAPPSQPEPRPTVTPSPTPTPAPKPTPTPAPAPSPAPAPAPSPRLPRPTLGGHGWPPRVSSPKSETPNLLDPAPPEAPADAGHDESGQDYDSSSFKPMTPIPIDDGGSGSR